MRHKKDKNRNPILWTAYLWVLMISIAGLTACSYIEPRETITNERVINPDTSKASEEAIVNSSLDTPIENDPSESIFLPVQEPQAEIETANGQEGDRTTEQGKEQKTIPAPKPNEEPTNIQVPQPNKEPTNIQVPQPNEETMNTQVPQQNEEPTNTQVPQPNEETINTQVPQPSVAPTNTPKVQPVIEPTKSPVPKETGEPSSTPVPSPTDKPKATPVPKPSGVTGDTSSPEPTSLPVPAPKQWPTPPPIKVSAKAEEYADTILEFLIEADMEEVEKVKAVHDYIVLNTAYDNREPLNIPKESFAIEGVLFHRKAVCQGYAETFQLFMELLDIDSKFVVGADSRTGIGHAWNMVSLNGEWYHVDVTWDDPVPDREGIAGYQYFLVTDKVMEVDHSWVKRDYPTCDSIDYQYYIYQDYIVDSIDNIEDKFMEQYNQGERTITVLYPENGMPDMSFLTNYDYLLQKVDDKYIASYQYYKPWRLGDYTVMTFLMK